MPGLKVLTDRTGGRHKRVRWGFIPPALASSGAFSYALAGLSEGAVWWRAAFAIAVIGSALACGIAARTLKPAPVLRTRQRGMSQPTVIVTALLRGAARLHSAPAAASGPKRRPVSGSF
jgi:hypothetical protein